MKYSKIYIYTNNNMEHKRNVYVTDDLQVSTGMLPNETLPLLAKELAAIAKRSAYKRVNPYKFDSQSDRHVYVLYGEPRGNMYEIMRKQIIRVSHKGNFKIPNDTFLFDLLDYFVEDGLLNKDYEFIGNLDEELGLKVKEVYDTSTLIEEGFIFPEAR